MEPPDAWAPRLLLLALLLGARPGVQAGVQVSVAPLVEVMRGETVTLDCTPLGDYGQYQLKWFLAERSGARHLLAEAHVQGSEVKAKVHPSRGRSPPYQLQGQGHLVLVEAQVKDERDYVCVVAAGAAGTAEATSKLQVFGACLRARGRGLVQGAGPGWGGAREGAGPGQRGAGPGAGAERGGAGPG